MAALAAGLAAGAVAALLKAAPSTVRPWFENLAAFFWPMPLTRLMKSFQSLKFPFLRWSRILPDSAGPMPLMLSSSASVALFTSMPAKQTAAYNRARMSRNFLNMVQLPWVKKCKCPGAAGSRQLRQRCGPADAESLYVIDADRAPLGDGGLGFDQFGNRAHAELLTGQHNRFGLGQGRAVREDVLDHGSVDLEKVELEILEGRERHLVAANEAVYRETAAERPEYVHSGLC